ncbi:MAG: hypothetical protein ACE5Z5_15035, partial [Candidatus Bathyarchaeia archaeon]
SYLKAGVSVGVGVGVLVGGARVGVAVGRVVSVAVAVAVGVGGTGVGVEVKVGVGAIGLLVGVGVDDSGVAVGGRKISAGVGEAMGTRTGREKDGRFKGRKKIAKAAMASTAPLTPSMSHQETFLLPNA